LQSAFFGENAHFDMDVAAIIRYFAVLFNESGGWQVPGTLRTPCRAASFQLTGKKDRFHFIPITTGTSP
jgi:hypothetical protein